MMIPVEHMTVQDLREYAADIVKADQLGGAPGRMWVHNFVARLIGEIARLRDTEIVVCKTKWHDHEPQNVAIEPEPATQLELLELTRMMGARNG